MLATGGWFARFDDPGAYAAAMHNSDCRVLPSQGGGFAAELALVRLARVNLIGGAESGPRLHEVAMTPERLFFRLGPPHGPGTALNGEIDPPGQLRVGSGGFPVAERSFGAVAWRASSFRHAELEALGATLGIAVAPGRLGQGERFRPGPELLARLDRLQRAALRLARDHPAVLAHPVAAAMLDAQLGEAHVAALAGGVSGIDRAAQRRGHLILQRIEAHLAGHLTERLSLSALCAVGQCSARTLEVLFHDRFGLTLNRYLRARRLALARERLRRPGPQTVSEVALDCGFWELGRFAQAYRAAYGERPSETLRRRTD